MFKAIFNENCSEIEEDSNLHPLKGYTGYWGNELRMIISKTFPNKTI